MTTKFNTEVDHVLWLMEKTYDRPSLIECATDAVRNLKTVHEDEMQDRPQMLGDILSGALNQNRERTFPLICMIKALRDVQPGMGLKEAKDTVEHMVAKVREYAMQHGDKSYY